MKFEWDEEKNIINKKKHNISFETAAHVFDDPECIEIGRASCRERVYVLV